MEWYFTVLRKYADFDGRARRKEYWMYQLVNFAVVMILYVSDAFAAIFDTGLGIGVLTIGYSLAVLIPGLAVQVRRLHDTGRSGWWIFVGLVPVIGAFALLAFMLIEGDAGANEYGDDPKLEAA